LADDSVFITITKAQLAEPQVLIRGDGTVWLLIALNWWDIATVLWWFLTPSDKRSKVRIRLEGDMSVRCHAIRVARKHYTTSEKHWRKNGK